LNHKIYINLPENEIQSFKSEGYFITGETPEISINAIRDAKKEADNDAGLIEADPNTAQFRGNVLLDGETGLNGWHVVCYRQDWSVVASRTTYTHWKYGAGYYNTISANPTDLDVCLAPRYDVVLYDGQWEWKVYEDNCYLCPGSWMWNWHWSYSGGFCGSIPNCEIGLYCPD